MPGFCPWLDLLIPFFFYKEPIGPPQFPSYPFENMPWSKTPVVTHILAITPISLLPSVTLERVGFPPAVAEGYPYGPQLYIFRKLSTEPAILFHPASDLRLTVLPVDFTNELLAKLCSCGTYTHWVTLSNFILLFG